MTNLDPDPDNQPYTRLLISISTLASTIAAFTWLALLVCGQ